LQEAGIIRVDGRTIAINDLDALRQVASGS